MGGVEKGCGEVLRCGEFAAGKGLGGNRGI
jgi:hypothetical protein